MLIQFGSPDSYVHSVCLDISAISVAENILISFAIVVDRRLRRPSNRYLLSLALTDICISLGLIPLEMTYVLSYPEWSLGPRETNVFNSVWLFSIAGSFVGVLVITVEGYRAVLSLVRYREVVSWGRTLMITTLVWLYVVVVVILILAIVFTRAAPAFEDVFQ